LPFDLGVQASAMVVKHVGLGKEWERERERRELKATRAAQGEGSARRASLLVYGLQGAFRFFTLAHFESDDQRKT
jgi:hypothetical protein